MSEKSTEMIMPMADKEKAEKMLAFAQSLTSEKNRQFEAYLKAAESGWQFAANIGLEMLMSGTV